MVPELIAEVERLRAAPAAGTVEKDAARYQVLRSVVWPANVPISMSKMPPLGQSCEERIDMLCDIAIEAHSKAGKDAVPATAGSDQV
jgi:hypothetical protein